jgi:hypothetical protein
VNATDRSFNKAIPTFTVHQFLNALYSTSYHTAINAIDENILQGRMNFLMFDSTNEHLTPDLFQPLCYKLLRRCSALQLAPAQKSYDKLLPFYYGDPDEQFDLTKVGAILVQDKNRVRGSKPSQLLGEDFFTVFGPKPRQDSIRKSFDNIISNNPTVKLLYLLFDFGTNDVSLEVDEQIFACIDSLHVRNEVRALFLDTAPLVKDDDIAVTYQSTMFFMLINIKKMEIFGL